MELISIASADKISLILIFHVSLQQVFLSS